MMRGIVVRMHQHQPALAHQFLDARLRVADGFAEKQHLGAVRAGGRHLHKGVVTGITMVAGMPSRAAW